MRKTQPSCGSSQKKLIDDNPRPRKLTILSREDGSCITGKEAVNAFAKSYEQESDIKLPRERIREVRQETKALHEQRTDGKTRMSDNLTIQAALKKLKKKKSPGTGGITNEMLKYLGYKARRTLLLKFNLSWHSGVFP